MISTRIFRSRPPWTPHQKRSRSSRSMKPCSFGETRWKLELGRLLENDGNGCMTLKKICYKIAFVCHSCQWIHHDVEDFNDGKWNDWTTKKSWLESLLNLTRLETLAWDVAFWICFGDLWIWGFLRCWKAPWIEWLRICWSSWHLEKVGRIEGKQDLAWISPCYVCCPHCCFSCNELKVKFTKVYAPMYIVSLKLMQRSQIWFHASPTFVN